MHKISRWFKGPGPGPQVIITSHQNLFTNSGLEIPHDVVGLIVDEVALLDDENHSSIKTCALISKAFLDRSRSYIFHTVDLGFHGSQAEEKDLSAAEEKKLSEKGKRFIKALDASPEIALYVREFRIGQYAPKAGRMRLPSFLQQFENATTFCLCFSEIQFSTVHNGIIVFPYPWRWLDRSFRQEIIRIINRPETKEIALHGLIGIPSSLLKSFCHIPTLTLMQCYFSNVKGVHNSDGFSITMGALESFTFRKLDLPLTLQPFLQRLPSSSCTSKILSNSRIFNRVLEVQVNSDTLLLTARNSAHLDINGPHLSNEFIFVMGNSYNFGQQFSNQKNNRMRDITFFLTIHQGQGGLKRPECRPLLEVIASSKFKRCKLVRLVSLPSKRLQPGDIELAWLLVKNFFPAIGEATMW